MDENKKQKPRTSSKVKQRYNEKHYKQVAAQVKPELAERLSSYREKEGISMAQFIERALDHLDTPSEKDV